MSSSRLPTVVSGVVGAACASSSRVVIGVAETNGATFTSVQSSRELFVTTPQIVITPRRGITAGVSEVITTERGVASASSSAGGLGRAPPEPVRRAAEERATAPTHHPGRGRALHQGHPTSARVLERARLTAAMLSSGPAPPGCPAGPVRGTADVTLEWSPVSEEPLLISDVQARVVAELARIAPVTDELGARFAAAGEEIALVGGPVRDAMLGRLQNDLDFTTSATPEVTERLLQGWADATWDIGRAFGTIGCRRGEWQVEITTYRSEAYDPESRKPAVQYGDSLVGDLARRDFTVNSMALSLPAQQLEDPFGGVVDLAHRVLRTPGARRTPSPTTRCG